MREELIIDGENAVAGRLASYAAKQALLGKKIKIVNCDKVIILGKKKDIIQKFIRNRARGGTAQKGPYHHKIPEKILKRIIRGMLPYKAGRGREALNSMICYNQTPEELKNKKMIKSGKGKKGISLKEIVKMLSGGRD